MKTDVIGFTCGSFDLLHPGHMLMLKEAKEQCDYLIVGLQSDPTLDRDYKNKPIQTVEERKIMLDGVQYVARVIEYNTEKDLIELLRKIMPDIRIIGNDWKGKKYTGHELPIKMFFNTRTHNWSSTELRERVAASEKRKHL